LFVLAGQGDEIAIAKLNELFAQEEENALIPLDYSNMKQDRLLVLSREGDAEAALQLAYTYNDQGDIGKYIEFLKLSANGDNSMASFLLAKHYLENNGIRVGLRFLEASAMQGNGKAMAHYAELYREGTHVRKNQELSLVWYTLSNAFGEPENEYCRAAFANGLSPKQLKRIAERANKIVEDMAASN
jgi:TPR repeat protein